jgi:uncharacterized protein YjbI with pentapeptide repeats
MRLTARSTTIAMLVLVCAPLAFQPVRAENASHRERLDTTHECQSCDLSSGTFGDLHGADLSGADLTGATLYHSNLSGANLTGANLSQANARSANFAHAKLDGANLDGANLKDAQGVNFTGAITTSATICPSGDAGPCR